MFIGNSVRPRAFTKTSGKSIDWTITQRTAWVTCALFFNWLQRSNAHFSKQNRKMLLLINNCCAHGTSSTLPKMNNVEIVFLSPITTYKLQKCDARSTAALKLCYRNFQMERAIDLSKEEPCSDIYKVNILTVMLSVLPIFNRW